MTDDNRTRAAELTAMLDRMIEDNDRAALERSREQHEEWMRASHWSVMNAGPTGGFVQFASHTAAPTAAIELHNVVALTEATLCCRCGEYIAIGETAHTVTVTEGGKVTHRQATHLRHLRA